MRSFLLLSPSAPSVCVFPGSESCNAAFIWRDNLVSSAFDCRIVKCMVGYIFTGGLDVLINLFMINSAVLINT